MDLVKTGIYKICHYESQYTHISLETDFISFFSDTIWFYNNVRLYV